MLLRLLFIVFACLLQFSSFAGDTNVTDFNRSKTEIAEEQMFFSASERNIFNACEKTTARFIFRHHEKENKKTGDNKGTVISQLYYYFSRHTSRLIVSLQCETVPVFVLLRDFRI